MAKQKKSDRFQLVLELAERKEQSAMDVLTKARAYLDQQLGQQTMLSNYRSQYVNDLKDRMSGISSVAQLVSNQGFIRQLDQAIEQQESVVEHARVSYEKALDEWRALHEKSKGIKDLLNRTIRQ